MFANTCIWAAILSGAGSAMRDIRIQGVPDQPFRVASEVLTQARDRRRRGDRHSD
jgi:hypothetical protein